MNNSVGGYIAQRLVDLDVSDYFAIPGDYNLVLLDEIIKEKQLNMINNTCIETHMGIYVFS